MRFRNIKNKDEIVSVSKLTINNYEDYYGKWSSYFKNDNPIHIEIGSGKCSFLFLMAEKHPNINFIGVEKFKSVLAQGIKNRIVYPNVRFIWIDAIDIDKVFSKEVEKIYLNFSDPWPKKRHVKRRLTSPLFLEKYDKIFIGDRIIEQKTDNKNLFSYSIESLSQYGYYFKNISLDLHNESINEVTTEYEEKFIKEDKKIYKLLAIKNK